MKEMFLNRIQKNYKNLSSWLKKEQISAYRLYDRDIPQYPFAIDNFDNSFVIYHYEAKYNQQKYDDLDKEKLEHVKESLKELFSIGDENIYLKFRRHQKGTMQYEKFSEQEERKLISENGLKYIINLTEYLDCGIFLDHRKTRKIIYSLSKDKNVLNLFAYTGSVSVSAAAGGAKKVTTVDMSNTYLDWAEQNFKLNKIPCEMHEFIRADIIAWLPDFAKKSKKFDLIFIDPPSFSNSKKMKEHFDIQRDYKFLLDHCKQLLSANGEIYFSNNLKSFEIDLEYLKNNFEFENWTEKSIPKDYRDKKIHHLWKFKNLK